ncbi:MAG: hypothetical protein K2K82_01535 [Muribaculaceae bacterium]|nr:hypothetical protein [Muribaculaceae bacterium]
MMNKTLIISAIATIGFVANATEPLDSVFNELKTREGITEIEVQYSGSFSDDCRGFMFQRGKGNGWTKGPRLMIPNVSADEAARFLTIFENSEAETGWVSRRHNNRATFDEPARMGYAMDYDDDTRTLYFLRATVEDEICIPMDWTVRDYYYAPVKKASNPVAASRNMTAAFARLYSELKYNSAFYDKAAENLAIVYESLLDKFADADEYQAYRMLQQLAAACGDGHTYVYGMRLDQVAVSSPFTTILLDDRLFIDSVDSEQLEADGMKRGMEILAVNGESPREYAEKNLKPYVSSSTPQWTDHLMFDGHGLSSGRKGAPLNLTLSSDGGKHIVEVIHNIGDGAGSTRRRTPRLPGFEITKGGIAVLTLPDFQSQKVTEYFDSVYPQILKSKALIIDLRGNEGGNSGYGDYILRHFSSDFIPTARWSSPTYVPALASWGRTAPDYVSESGKMSPIHDVTPYEGEIILLTDRGTFSAAEDFCSLFRGMNRGLIIGTPTGGSTGNGVQVKLTKDIYANICSKHDFMPDGTEFVGIGIIPDIEIEETPATYFSETRDAAKDAAISTLRGKKK